MGDGQIKTDLNLPTQTAIVEVTDTTGRLVDRTSFATRAEADQYADAQRTQGLKVSVSAITVSSDKE